jgi:hypothetical protein
LIERGDRNMGGLIEWHTPVVVVVGASRD